MELLDLWEARVIYGRTAKESIDSVAAQVENGLQELKYSLDTGPRFTAMGQKISPSDLFLQMERQITNLFLNNAPNVHRLHGEALVSTDDSYEAVVPTGNCDVEQLVTYIDSETSPLILVNQDLVDKMDLTNQAALINHEAFYTLLRNISQQQEANSIRVRRAIGYVYAGNSFANIDSILPQKYIACGSDPNTNQSILYFYQGQDQKFYELRSVMFGEFAIGMTPSVVSNSVVQYEDLLTNHLCKLNEMTGVDIPGVGPVDFTESNSFSMFCKQDKLLTYLSIGNGNTIDFNNTQLTQKMSCGVEDKSNP